MSAQQQWLKRFTPDDYKQLVREMDSVSFSLYLNAGSYELSCLIFFTAWTLKLMFACTVVDSRLIVNN